MADAEYQFSPVEQVIADGCAEIGKLLLGFGEENGLGQAAQQLSELSRKWRARADVARQQNTGGYVELMKCIEEIEFLAELWKQEDDEQPETATDHQAAPPPPGV